MLLRTLRHEATRAIDDVRRIVDDIRPPVLDQLGLGGAIAAHAHVLRRANRDIILDSATIVRPGGSVSVTRGGAFA